MGKGTAWVTLATNDSYSLGALVLAHSLKQVGTGHQLAVLVTPGVTNAMREKLASVFNLVQDVNILDSKDATNLRLLKRPELGITFTKLHCWRLTQFDKCVFLDADTLVLQNCDELFDREELSAAPDVGWPDCFNSGVFVYRPSNETYEKLVQFALEKGSFDGGDQGLLNLYFSDWATKDISKHLPFIYNLCSTACYSYAPAFKQFGLDAKIIHFIGSSKPWLQYFNPETRTVQPSQELTHLQGALQYWWNIFCTVIHPQLTTEMSGLAGAFAQLTLGAPRTPEQSALDDHLRRQGWETGNIDYLGRDSFDNIWSKICATLSAGLPAPSPAKATENLELTEVPSSTQDTTISSSVTPSETPKPVSETVQDIPLEQSKVIVEEKSTVVTEAPQIQADVKVETDVSKQPESTQTPISTVSAEEATPKGHDSVQEPSEVSPTPASALPTEAPKETVPEVGKSIEAVSPTSQEEPSSLISAEAPPTETLSLETSSLAADSPLPQTETIVPQKSELVASLPPKEPQIPEATSPPQQPTEESKTKSAVSEELPASEPISASQQSTEESKTAPEPTSVPQRQIEEPKSEPAPSLPSEGPPPTESTAPPQPVTEEAKVESVTSPAPTSPSKEPPSTESAAPPQPLVEEAKVESIASSAPSPPSKEPPSTESAAPLQPLTLKAKAESVISPPSKEPPPIAPSQPLIEKTKIESVASPSSKEPPPIESIAPSQPHTKKTKVESVATPPSKEPPKPEPAVAPQQAAEDSKQSKSSTTTPISAETPPATKTETKVKKTVIKKKPPSIPAAPTTEPVTPATKPVTPEAAKPSAATESGAVASETAATPDSSAPSTPESGTAPATVKTKVGSELTKTAAKPKAEKTDATTAASGSSPTPPPRKAATAGKKTKPKK